MKEWLASLPAIPVSTLLLYIIASVLSLLLLAYLGYQARRSWRRLDELDLKERFTARNDFIKTAAQILGGTFFLFGLYFTWANLVATQEKNVTDLYTKAIEQLGNEKSLQVRLGGIYALERIARDSEKDYWPIMEILSAYVRTWSLRQEEPIGKQDKHINLLEVEPTPDIQAILTLIGRRVHTYKKGEDNRLNLSKAYLIGANLKFAHLEGAILKEAILRYAKLWNIQLDYANLNDANLEYAELFNANLNNADFWDANLINTILEKASLINANLENAKLQNANLSYANLEGTNLKNAHLEGANLTGVVGLTKSQIDSAFKDNYTKRPYLGN